MPRKHHQAWTQYKPQPSYSPSRASPTPSNDNPSVNDLLHTLRLSSSSPRTSKSLPQTPSVPPPLQSLLGTPAPPPPPPRRRQLPLRNPRIPGPPPPTSWLIPPTPDDSAPVPRISNAPTTEYRFLPGLDPPAQGSLQDLALRYVVRNWRFHRRYDYRDIPLLPTRVKEVLLCYLTAQQRASMTPELLCWLFAGDAADVRYLDLSGTRGEVVREVVKVLKPPRREAGEWEEEAREEGGFTGITHLRVGGARWGSLVRCVPGVTHLSLVSAEGGHSLTELVKRLLCLKWIEVDETWVEVLMDVGEEWAGTWRRVGTVEVRGVGGKVGLLREKVREVRKRRGVGGWCQVVEVDG